MGALEGLAIQGGVEAFAGRVVGAGADRAHRPCDPELVAEVGEGLGSLLRFKLLKRQMDGRANFDLLRRRVLLSP
jgi:hypothetical protein